MDVEEELRASWNTGDFAAVAKRALRAYGPEIMGVLRAMHRHEADAADAFSAFTQDLWVGLPSFQWACSMRTWAFVLARHASIRQGEAAAVRWKRERPVAHSAELEEIAQRVRTETAAYLKTEVRDRFRELRAGLDDEEQLILMLRVDRNLDFKDVARVLVGTEGSTDDATLTREAARVRKRFQLLKEKLREAGEAAGLISKRDASDES
jgi:RNA polymerase sigma-70 factor (ECF subfamily)